MNILFSIIGLVILLYSAILHEIAHGYVADRLGDPTARLKGRLTLDPRPHIDLFLSILLPLALFLSGSPVIFGGAKPVPVDPFNLKEGRKDIALVSLAGPLTNVILAVIAALVLKIISFVTGINNSLLFSGTVIIIRLILTMVVNYNILLAIFNLLPIPPLDGSKIFALFLPEKEARAYLSLSNIGIFILLVLLMFPIGGFSLETLIFTLFSFAKNLLGV